MTFWCLLQGSKLDSESAPQSGGEARVMLGSEPSLHVRGMVSDSPISGDLRARYGVDLAHVYVNHAR